MLDKSVVKGVKLSIAKKKNLTTAQKQPTLLRPSDLSASCTGLYYGAINAIS